MMKMSFKEIIEQHPIAAQIFVFLRHKCPSEFISNDGWVQLFLVRKSLNLTNEESGVLQHIHHYNSERREHHQIELKYAKEWFVRMKTCHSLTIIDENTILKRFNPKLGQKGYVLLRADKQKYEPGTSLKPLNNRNCNCVRLNNRPGKFHYARLTIDLFELSKETPIYVLDEKGVFVRGDILAKYIIFEYLRMS